MLFVTSLGLAIAVTVFAATLLAHLLEDTYVVFSKGGIKSLPWAIVTGLIIGVANYRVPKMGPVGAVIAIVAILAVLTVLTLIFALEVGYWRELLLFVLILGISFLPFAAVTQRLTEVVEMPNLVIALFRELPRLSTLLYAGIGSVSILAFFESNSANAKRYRTLKHVAVATCAIVLVVTLAGCVAHQTGDPARLAATTEPVEEAAEGETETNKPTPEEPVAPAPKAEANQTSADEGQPAASSEAQATFLRAESKSEPFWGTYFNERVRDDPVTAYDFGPSLWKEGMSALEADIALEEVWQLDPIAGVSAMGLTDAVLGTELLGFSYYNPSGEGPSREGLVFDRDLNEWKDWQTAMNQKGEYFIAHPEEYATVLSLFFQKNDRAAKTIETATEGIEDQFYMDPDVLPGKHPTLVIMETNDHSGHLMTYTHMVKGNKYVIQFRLDCGGQGANVGKVLHAEPVANKAPAPAQPAVAKMTPKTTASTPKPSSTPTQASTPTQQSTPKQSTPTQSTPTATTPTELTSTPSTPTQATTPQGSTPTVVTPPQQVTPPSVPTAPAIPDGRGETPPVSVPKDTTQGTQGQVVKPNDNLGTGPSTSSGSGGWWSSEEKPAERAPSTSKTQEEYKETVEHLDDLNNPSSPTRQQTPENNPESKPSYTPPTSTTGGGTKEAPPVVDSTAETGRKNADGTTSAPIDTPTPVKPPAQPANNQGSEAEKPSSSSTGSGSGSSQGSGSSSSSGGSSGSSSTVQHETGPDATKKAESDGTNVTDQGAAGHFEDQFD